MTKSLMTAFLVFSAVPAFSGENLLKNGDFEEEGTAGPMDWLFDEKLAPKGTVEVVKAKSTLNKKGKLALQLSPTAKNTDQDHLLGIFQYFSARHYKGKTLQLSGRLLAKGEATNALAMFVINKDGSFSQKGAVLVRTAKEGDWGEVKGELAIEGGMDTLVVVCLAGGISGQALFDDVSVSVK